MILAIKRLVQIMTIRTLGARIPLLLASFVLVVACWGRARLQEQGAESHVGMGYEALKQDNFEGAAREFRAALDLDPALVLRARFPLAVALFEMHKANEARQELESVRREVGDHPNVLYYLGRLDVEEQKFPSAIRNLSKAVAEPPFPDTAYYLGFAYFKQGDLSAAEKWLQQAARLNPQDSRIPYQLSLVYRKQGRQQDAAQALALSSELRRRKENDTALKGECTQKLDQGLGDEARRICQQLYDPNNAEKLTALGTIYGQHGDVEDALKPLQRAAELSPQSPQMQYNLALVYYQLNRFEEARAALANALKRWPDLFQLHRLYGAVLVKLGEEVKGYEALRRAYQLNPQDSGTTDLLYTSTLRLAQKNQDAGKYPDSLRYLQEAAKLRPREPEPHRRMAEIYTRTAQTAQARAEQRQAEQLSKNSSD
jgi:protein O-GlcNAc transferase